MARKERIPFVLVLAGSAALVAGLACRGSSTVTGPSNGTTSMNISGSWSGAFQSDDAMACGASAASATFEQVGSEITGSLQTSDCGVRGAFKATLSGNSLTGSVAMEGCTGGRFSGTVTGSSVSLSIGDLTKPLITGDQVVYSGGIVTLRR